MKKILLVAILLILTAKIYGQTTTPVTKIKPEDKRNNLYAVKFENFKFKLWGDDDICYNFLNIYAIHADNSKTLLYTSNKCCGHVIEIEFPLHYAFVNKKITSLYVDAKATETRDRFPLSDKCDEDISQSKSIYAVSDCYSAYFNSYHRHGGGEGDSNIEFTYTILPLHHLQSEANNTYLPTDDKITLYDKAGFANTSSYKYQYCFLGIDGIWKNVPSNLYNADKLTLSAKDLFPTNYLNYVEKIISFRSISCTDTAAYSDFVHLAIRPSAPHIESVTPVMPTCHGDEDGKLIIKFDRALYNDECGINLPNESFCGETLFLSFDGETKEHDTIKIDPTTFEYTYENLPAGTYNLGLIDAIYYKRDGVIDSIYPYTMDDRHRDTAIIPDRPALKLESLSADSVHCFGGSDGKIHLKVSGGVGKFNAYLKNNQNRYIDTVRNFAANTNVTFFNLPKGNYTVEIADTNGCTKDINGNILKYNIEVYQPLNQVVINTEKNWTVMPKCFDGSDGWIQISIRGGTPPYTARWRDSTGARILGATTFANGIYTSKIENIRAGKYFVTVYDSNYSKAIPANEENCSGCYDTMTITLGQPPKLVAEIEEAHYITCYGDSDGELVVHASGGTTLPLYVNHYPYHYEWFMEINGVIKPMLITDSILSDLSLGVYGVKVTDANGCTFDTIFKLAQPDTLTVKTEVLQNVLCNGENTGAILAVAAGGTPPYSYIWSNGDTAAEIHNLSVGGYVVYVRDARYADNGITGHYCFAQNQAFITSPNGIEFNAAVKNPTCNGYSDGSVILNVTGGLAPYSYLWDDGSTENYRNNLPKGIYNVAVTDANGCIISQTYTLADPDAIVVNLGNDITLCKNQTALIDGNTGIADAYYEWTDETGTVLSYSSEYELTKSGIYRLTVTTQEGCTGSDEIVISQSDDEIDVDFVIATKVANNAKIYAVNITRLLLDRIEWIIPDGAVLLEESDDRIQLLFTKNGTYIVALKGYKGDCEKTLYKTVSVVNANEIEEDQSSEPFLKRFIAVPNPNDGNFDAIIELREPAEFKLILYDISGSIVEATQTYNAMNQTIRFNRSVFSAGTYLLKFVSAKTVSVFKIIIQ